MYEKVILHDLLHLVQIFDFYFNLSTLICIPTNKLNIVLDNKCFIAINQCLYTSYYGYAFRHLHIIFATPMPFIVIKFGINYKDYKMFLPIALYERVTT